MREMAICLRQMRAVVSCAIETPRGRGWHCAGNWQALEVAAFQAIGDNYTDGPFVFPCPPELAARAEFFFPDSPLAPSLFPPESEAHP